MSELHNINELPDSMFPLSLILINRYQQEDPFLSEKPKLSEYQKGSFLLEGRNTIELVTYKDNLVIPQKLQKYVLQWYRTRLLNPVPDRRESTILQRLYWPSIIEYIRGVIMGCDMCQLTERSTKKYSKLPANPTEEILQNKLCVYFMGPYKIHRKIKQPLILKPVTMLDPVTGWFLIKQYSNKKAMTITNLVEN